MSEEFKITNFKLKLEPQLASKIEDVINDAHKLAQQLNVIVCFTFNGCYMEIGAAHKKEWLLESWKHYLTNMSQYKGDG